jgi:RNA recognition motif-containing protein
MKIYVGNLSFNTGDEGLRNAFSPFGTVREATVITDRDSGQSRGFGFVEIADDASAQAAIQALNGTALDGRSLKVNEAKPRTDRPRSNAGRSW